MKKIIVLAIIVLLIMLGISLLKDNKEDKTKNDNKKIEELKNACSEMAESSYINSLGGDAVKWYVFELEFIHQPIMNCKNNWKKYWEKSLKHPCLMGIGCL